jgi:hypothetical protein
VRLTRAADLAWSAALTVAERFDALPVSPQGIGDRLLGLTRPPRRPDTWWTPVAWRLADAGAADALRAGHHLVQRAVRGWSDADVADLIDTLPTTVGAQLLALADRVEWRAADPEDPDHAAAAAFTAQLRAHGRTLVAHGDPEGERARTSEAWHDVATTRGHDRGLEVRLAAAHRWAVADASAEVRASLVWVADHLDELWE